MIRFIHCFYDSSYKPRGCNASFVTLVPKRDNQSTLNEFRHILLVECVYKVIIKMLANKLEPGFTEYD